MDYTNLIDKVNIPELVKALRNHASKESDCRSCKYYYYNIVKYDTCSSSLCAAAADAIEALQAEVKRLQDKLCDWCMVCPKERRKPEDCELLSETLVMYGPSEAKMEARDESISKFADGEWWKEARK